MEVDIGSLVTFHNQPWFVSRTTSTGGVWEIMLQQGSRKQWIGLSDLPTPMADCPDLQHPFFRELLRVVLSSLTSSTHLFEVWDNHKSDPIACGLARVAIRQILDSDSVDGMDPNEGAVLVAMWQDLLRRECALCSTKIVPNP